MIEYNEEKYVTASEVAKRFGVSLGTCKNNVLSTLTACYLPGRRRPVYRLTEVEALSQVHVVERESLPLTLIRKVAP